MLMFNPEIKATCIICSSAGWYTLPDNKIQWPYGIQHTQLTEEKCKLFYKLPIILSVGKEDKPGKSFNKAK